MLELLVVVSLIGVLSAAVVSRYGRDVLREFGARGEAHGLWLDMQRVQWEAIRSGRPHSVVFDGPDGGPWTGYRLVEGTGGGGTLLDEPRVFEEQFRVTGSASTVEFTFEGQAAAAWSGRLKGPRRTWQIDVVPLSGAVRVTEVR